jgi:hypothetical protein
MIEEESHMRLLTRESCVALLSVLLVAGCGGRSSGASGTTAGGSPGTVPLPPVTPDPTQNPNTVRSRYSFNNQCFALVSRSSGKYVAAAGAGYSATADKVTDAEAFYMKPSALGQYLLYGRSSKLLLGAAPASTQDLASATDDAIFTLKSNGDTTDYPAAPQFDKTPALADLNAYRNYADPNKLDTVFTLTANNGQRLAVDAGNVVTLAAAADAATQRFSFEAVSGCATFPEAHDNTSGDTFKGTYKDPVTGKDRVLGMADVHVHMMSSTFLGGALHGAPFHKFGITHALDDCARTHGPMGSKDALAAAFENDTNGHKTDGWPTFSEWPARDSLTHHAIYWKWIERAWKGGLRIVVNDLVENETLCKLQRNASGNPLLNCNEMNSAHNQIGTLYAMQDYVDAQYGGRGKGFFQIVLDPAAARAKIADGKLAVIIGLEVSNTLNCKLTYNPLRQKEPYQEDGSPTENSYGCSMDEAAPNGIRPQLLEMKALGLRQMITIHEFDNAFGGNGIFNDLILNLGSRENSGGIPVGTPTGPFSASPLPSPTGEFWTTYTCPNQTDPGFSGYLWGNSGGTILKNIGLPVPAYTGQGGRPGGTAAYYPNTNQCNARWLTPLGLYTYTQLMREGIIFDMDHLEIAMKSQALELAEAQSIPYPFVSTHGTFGGETNNQAGRNLKNGGFQYPSVGSVKGFLSDLKETRTLSDKVNNPNLFGFGFGTDTDGLSGQEGPRSNITPGKELKYPFVLFSGAPFDAIPEFANMMSPVTFNQPSERDAAMGTGTNGKTWTQDLDGNAHYGMMSDFVQEMRLEGTPEDMRTLFNSAEVYLQTWERTLASSAAINKGGFVTPPTILRQAPTPSEKFGDANSHYFYK